MKQCSKCQQIKNKTDFYKDNRNADRLQGKCKLCVKQYNKNNEAHIKTRGRDYIQSHTEQLILRNMEQRCNAPKNPAYKNYGGRGIKVLYKNYIELIDDIGYRPLGPTRFTLGRIDNNGNYGPGNCYWATYTEQQLNVRR